MSLLSGKHDFGDLNGQTVTFVERKVSRERANFLKTLLEHNGFTVIVEEIPPAEDTPDAPVLYTVATPDLTFNPVIYVYQRRLRTPDGRKVTPAYWNQESDKAKPQYWEG